MKLKIFFTLLVFILGLVYLLVPSPAYPDLTGGARSDEPGDTWQNPDQKGFYTNSDRQFVLHDIQSQFVIKILGFPLPSYRLNYRPEEAQTLVRDQLQSYYLEEIIYPLRQSIFVNGWEPKKSPKLAGKPADEIPDISLHGVPYDSKVTLRPVNSSAWARILIWTLIFPATYLTYFSVRRSVTSR
jgi:hypothetical protein